MAGADDPRAADRGRRRACTPADLEQIEAAASALACAADTAQAVHRTAEVLRCIGAATHSPVLRLAQGRCCCCSSPAARHDRQGAQARARILSAHEHLLDTLARQDEAGAHTWMSRHIRDFKKGYELAGLDVACRLSHVLRRDPRR
jgi:DNA-binding FadR family transcriptional regulator